MTQQIRWFAGAAHAAGLSEQQVHPDEVPDGATVRAHLEELSPPAGPVLQRCSFLADGSSLDADAAWPRAAAVIDVLPPFTGG